MIEKDDSDLVDEMLSNHNNDEAKSTTTQSSSNIKTSFEPEGDKKLGGQTESGDRRERKVLDYAREFVEDGHNGYELPVDLSKITIRVSNKMTSASGYYSPKNNRRGLVKISGRLMEKADWDDVQETIRHELVHAWQHQTKEWPRKGITGSKWTWHGPSFTQWERKLDISVRADAPAEQEYKYEIYCPDCGMIGGKQRKCKSLRQIINKGKRRCGSCGPSTQGDLWVEENGVELARMS